MAIDRTAYDALVDDSGDNTSGAVWNKAAIASVLLDPIDAAFPPIDSPAFTGVPTAPTAAPGTNTTQIATTAYVLANGGAPLNSPAFTGVPTAPTAAAGTNTTQIATTAFVLANGGGATVQTTTATGSQNDFALTARVTTLRVNNASLVTFTGFAAGFDGQRVQIVSVGAGQVDIKHQDSGSSAANRVINPVTASISLAAGSGSAVIQYDATTARWRTVSHGQGGWITRAFSASNYVGTGSMTWTVAGGGVSTDRYALNSMTRTLTFSFVITGTIGGTVGTTIQILIPGGFTAANTQSFMVLTTPASGTQQGGVAYVGAGGGAVNIALNVSGTGNWAAGSGTVNGTITIEVQ